MNVVKIGLVEHENGLVTQGLSPELDSICGVTHQDFLKVNTLTYWQLVVLQVYRTPYAFIFSGASGDETPDFTLANIQNLRAQIEEILGSHYERWHSRTSPKTSI